MHFNLNINSAKDELIFKPDSALVKFFVDSEKLERVVDEFFLSLNFPLGKIQKKNFLDKKSNELEYYSQTDEPSVIHVKKIKLDKDFSVDFFRNYFAGLIPSFKKKNIKTVHVVVPSFGDFKNHFETELKFLQTMLEGIHIGNYTFDNYKSDKQKPEELSFLIHYTDRKVLKSTIENSNKLMSAVFFARDLVNEPAITLTPA